jgi:hypothetical protein
MLVYHFKERLSVLETKGETMVEIINNMVVEVTSLKQYIVNSQPQSQSQSQCRSPPEIVSSQFNGIKMEVIEENDKTDVIVEEDDNDADDEADDETDDETDDDDTDDETIDDDMDIDNILEMEEIEEEYSMNVFEPEEEDTNKTFILPNYSMKIDGEDNTTNMDDNTTIVSDMEYASNPTDNLVEKPLYKMNLTELRGLVTKKGLETNPSKLKKQELIKLLEENQ